MSWWNPLSKSSSAGPPGRRSIDAPLLPNQAASPLAVVSAAHTLAGGCASSTVRSIRSGNAIVTVLLRCVATERLRHYGNRTVASRGWGGGVAESATRRTSGELGQGL